MEYKRRPPVVQAWSATELLGRDDAPFELRWMVSVGRIKHVGEVLEVMTRRVDVLGFPVFAKCEVSGTDMIVLEDRLDEYPLVIPFAEFTALYEAA